MNVVIDTREPPTIHKLFKDEGISRHLEVGDIFLPDCNVLVERKEYADLVASVYSGHLDKQLQQMAVLPYRCFVVIVGDLKAYQFASFSSKTSSKAARRPRWSVDSEMGLLASKARDFPTIHFLRAGNNHQFKTLIQKLVLKFSNDRKAPSIDDTELMRLAKIDINGPEDIQARMLTGIPNIGIATARALLRHAGTLEKLMGMTFEDIQDVPDVGEKTARVIYNALHDAPIPDAL